MGSQLFWSPSLVRVGARGRGLSTVAGSGDQRRRARPRAAGQPLPFQSAVLFGMVPWREAVAMGVDAVAALLGVIYRGQDGYQQLFIPDGCFYLIDLQRRTNVAPRRTLGL